MRRSADATIALAALAVLLCGAAPLVSYRIDGESISASLTGQPGDPARGRQIVASRQISACLLCHSGPFPDPHLQGSVAPPLDGVGSRLTEGQIRLRLVDPRKLNADTLMPAYYATDGLNRVGLAWQGRPILTAEQIEDVVAFLITLRSP
jgi:L-cysteine S-thiosulfotransferase